MLILSFAIIMTVQATGTPVLRRTAVPLPESKGIPNAGGIICFCVGETKTYIITR